jgi:iron complex outermembrane recepter protein
MRINISVIIILLILTTNISVSQTITITGIVINSKTEHAVPGVIITQNHGTEQIITDRNGCFAINLIDLLNSHLIFNHISYITKKIVPVNLPKTDSVLIEMDPFIQNLNEIEILDEGKSVRPTVIENISSKHIESTNLDDIGALISREPNVGGIKKGAGGIDPVVRGFKYSQVSVQLNNGTRIEGGCPNRMDPTAAHVNINDISNISILKGPFALKYGTAFGGLIILETYKPEFYKNYENHISLLAGGQTNHEGYRTGIRINGGNSRFSYIFSAGNSKYNDYKNGDGTIVKASSNNYNIKGGVGFKITDKNIISVDADRSWARNIDFPTLPMDERSDNTEVYELNYSGTEFNNSVNFIKSSIYYSNVQHEMDNKSRPFSDTVVAVSKISASNTGGKLAINFSAFKGTVEVGSNFEHIKKDGNRNKWLIMQPGLPKITEDLWNNAKIDNLGLYVEYQKQGAKFDWIFALRTDYNSASSDPMLRLKKNGEMVYENADTDSEYFNFSISGGVILPINEKSDLNISIGKGTRSPDMTERYIILLPVGYDPYDYLGNPKLKPETNFEIDVGFDRYCERSGHFEFSIFFSYVSDYISAVAVPPSVLKPQTKGVLGVKNFINIDKAYFTGFELKHATPERNKWQVFLSTAYTIGTNPSATQLIYKDGEVTDEIEIINDPLPEIPPIEGSLGFSYKLLNNKLIPEIRLRSVAKQNRVSKAYNEQSTPGFTLCNFKLKYKYNNNFNINFGVNNIFNIVYFEHLNRRIIGSRTPYYEPGRLFYTNLIINF